MTRDVVVDIEGSDISLSEETRKGAVFFDVVWGNVLPTDDGSRLFANVVIPVQYIGMMRYDQDGDFIIRARAPYHPVSSDFILRFITHDGSGYSAMLYSTEIPVEVPAYTYAFNRILPQRITACQLPIVNSDGEYLIRISKVDNNNFNRAYVYSASETDMEIGLSDDQAAKLLALCAAGKYYRYPITGVGATDYINSVVKNTDLSSKLSEQFEKNGMPVMSAEFDVSTGDLKTTFSGEQEPEPDENLTEIDKLDISLLKVADDDYIRKVQAISDTDGNSDIFSLMGMYGHLFGLYLFPDKTTEMSLLKDSVIGGSIDWNGNIVPGDEGQLVVKANVRKGSVVVIDLPDNRNDEFPAYSVFSPVDGSLAGFCRVGRKFVSKEGVLECGLVTQDTTVAYRISRENLDAGKGMFLLSETEANLKNLLAMVVDEVTGRLLGIIASSSNIADAVLDIKTNDLLTIKQEAEWTRT